MEDFTKTIALLFTEIRNPFIVTIFPKKTALIPKINSIIVSSDQKETAKPV